MQINESAPCTAPFIDKHIKIWYYVIKEERLMKVTTLYLSKKQIPFAEYYPKFVNSMYIKYIVVGAEQ